MKTGKNYHMDASVGGAIAMLEQYRGRDSWFNDDNGQPMTKKAALAELRRMRDAGQEMVKHKGCDNFDPAKGDPKLAAHAEQERERYASGAKAFAVVVELLEAAGEPTP